MILSMSATRGSALLYDTDLIGLRTEGREREIERERERERER